jgi:hypothetical protein
MGILAKTEIRIVSQSPANDERMPGRNVPGPRTFNRNFSPFPLPTGLKSAARQAATPRWRG